MNFTGAAGFDRTPGYKEQCITGFSKMLESQYDYYVEEGILDRSVELWEYLDGMMPREFEYSQYTEVWKKTVSGCFCSTDHDRSGHGSRIYNGRPPDG